MTANELTRAVDERRRSGQNVMIIDFLPDFAQRIVRGRRADHHCGHGTLSLEIRDLSLDTGEPSFGVVDEIERQATYTP